MGFYAWAVRDGDVNPFCKGNFDFDQDVDGGDAYTFKTHFGRSTLQNPCPPDGPAPMAITGQMTSYFVEDDGYYTRGVKTPGDRFRDNDDGTITDTLTGLIWAKNASLFSAASWVEAIEHVIAYNEVPGALYTDWRVPNVREMQSLIDYSQSRPALPPSPFITIFPDRVYWSATTKIGVEPTPFVDAYGVNLEDGTIAGYEKAGDTLYVWPVRGGH